MPRTTSAPRPESAPGQLAERPDGAKGTTIASDGASATRTRPTSMRRASTFETANYSYVAKDLQRVAMVGGSLLAGLIVLSFFIH